MGAVLSTEAIGLFLRAKVDNGVAAVVGGGEGIYEIAGVFFCYFSLSLKTKKSRYKERLKNVN